MDDVDRILEAEQSLQDIATELKRMRDAARLLESSHERANSVIDSAEVLVEEVRRFAAICKDIAAVDLSARIDSLGSEIAELKSDVKQSCDDISNLETAVWKIENRVIDHMRMSHKTD